MNESKNIKKTSSLALAAGNVKAAVAEDAGPVKDDDLATKEGDNLYVIRGRSHSPKPQQSSLGAALKKQNSVSAIVSAMEESMGSDSGSINNGRYVSTGDLQGGARSPTRGKTGFASRASRSSRAQQHSYTVQSQSPIRRTATMSTATAATASSGKRLSRSETLPDNHARNRAYGRADRSRVKSSLNRSSTATQTRIESKKIFQKIDADGGGGICIQEVQEFIMEDALYTKLKSLAVRLNKAPEETAKVAAKICLELATGKTGAEAHEAELTQQEFHRFRKKYMIDPAGAEELFQRSVFANFDADGSGELDEDELMPLLDTVFNAPGQTSRRSFTMAEMKDLVMDNFDADGDNTLSFAEVRGIISGGATVLRTMRDMKKEEEMEASKRSASEKDTSEKDEDDEDDDASEASSEADPRAMASRLLELLETPEEAEEAAMERERMNVSQHSDSEDEDEDDEDEGGAEEEEIDQHDEEHSEEEDNKPEEAEEHTEFTEREEDTIAAKNNLDMRKAGLGLMAFNEVIDRTKRKGQRKSKQAENTRMDSIELRMIEEQERQEKARHNSLKSIDLKLDDQLLQEELGEANEPTGSREEPGRLDVKRNQGLVLRDFPMPAQTENPQEAGIIVQKSMEVEDDESEDFDVCTWLDKKLSPSSYDKEGRALGGRKPMCHRGGGCVVM